jgi:hypothetical protein
MGVPVGFMIVGKGGDTAANVALFLRTLMEGVRGGTKEGMGCTPLCRMAREHQLAPADPASPVRA